MRGGATHDALHDERRTRCNHPIVDVSADEVASVDTADHCGARVAVPAASQRHEHGGAAARLRAHARVESGFILHLTLN